MGEGIVFFHYLCVVVYSLKPPVLHLFGVLDEGYPDVLDALSFTVHLTEDSSIYDEREDILYSIEPEKDVEIGADLEALNPLIVEPSGLLACCFMF